MPLSALAIDYIRCCLYALLIIAMDDGAPVYASVINCVMPRHYFADIMIVLLMPPLCRVLALLLMLICRCYYAACSLASCHILLSYAIRRCHASAMLTLTPLPFFSRCRRRCHTLCYMRQIRRHYFLYVITPYDSCCLRLCCHA